LGGRAEPRIRFAGNAHGCNAGHLRNHRLDFLGETFQPGDIDHRMAAAEQMDVPVVIDPGAIARATEPSSRTASRGRHGCKYPPNMPSPRKYSSPSSRISVR
jgi:hypothetical protein